MDATTATETNAFLTWFQTSGQVVYIILQMAYWVIVSLAAVFAAWQAKRLVDFKVGKAKKAEPAEGSVAVEEFVD